MIPTTDMHLLAERARWQTHNHDEQIEQLLRAIDTLRDRIVNEVGRVDYERKLGGEAHPYTHSDSAADISWLITQALANMSVDTLIRSAAALTVTEQTLRAVARTRAKMPAAIAKAWARWEAVEAQARLDRREAKKREEEEGTEGKCEAEAFTRALGGWRRCRRNATTGRDGRNVCKQHATKAGVRYINVLHREETKR